MSINNYNFYKHCDIESNGLLLIYDTPACRFT